MKSPRQIAEERYEEAATFSRLSEELEAILERKPSIWLLLREKAKSATEADRAWEATQEGIQEMKIRLTLKALEKKMAASKSLLDVLRDEARGTM